MLCQASFDGLGATAGLSSSAENTVGQANRGTPQSTIDRALEILDRFCGLFERPMPGWRRVLELRRLGVPEIDLPRRLLYDLCVLRWP